LSERLTEEEMAKEQVKLHTNVMPTSEVYHALTIL
jgi:hypothetical protein